MEKELIEKITSYIATRKAEIALMYKWEQDESQCAWFDGNVEAFEKIEEKIEEIINAQPQGPRTV